MASMRYSSCIFHSRIPHFQRPPPLNVGEALRLQDWESLRPKNKSIESTAVFFVTLEQHPITLSELVADAPSRRSCAALHAA